MQSVLESLNISFLSIELGKVRLEKDLTIKELEELNFSLKNFELEVMEDKRKILVERIKLLIIELFHSDEVELRLKFSEHLSQTLQYDYTYLSNVFSELEGSTIEKFYISQRIERVKELMIYEELSITDIAHQLNFSSLSHLCSQFKKVTNQT
ncbi:MAG: helix-turn-helix domain-containing protein, partial [Flavisolibacter sp.]